MLVQMERVISMALIYPESFDRIDKYRNTVHKPATAAFTVFELNGKKYFQIDTFGTTERVMPEKISQSIQIDKKMAEKLVDLLRQEFSID